MTNLAKPVDEGERFGMPILAVTAVGKEMARDHRYLALACRIAAELGAHFMKTYYCENFQKIVEVFRKSKKSVPVFCDKHLSYDRTQVHEMVETARSIGFVRGGGIRSFRSIHRPKMTTRQPGRSRRPLVPSSPIWPPIARH